MPEFGTTKAAIDLGTNTILMVTGRRSPNDGDIEILDDAHAIARLGQGVDARRCIHDETIVRVCGHLSAYRDRARALGATEIVARGTSALRDAANKKAFMATVLSETGLDLRELSGREEAILTFAGAAFGLQLPHRYAVIDIGGGSTELAFGSLLADGSSRVAESASVDVGAVRVSERFFTTLPPTQAQVDAARRMARDALSGLFQLPGVVQLVGVAGTVTTLGAMAEKHTDFGSGRLDGSFLSREQVIELSDCLLAMSLQEIRALPQVSDQRADIIGAGSLILREYLDLFDHPGLMVSTRGIRYGLLMQMLK